MPEFLLGADALDAITEELRAVEVPDELSPPADAPAGDPGTSFSGQGDAAGDGGGDPTGPPAEPAAPPPSRTLNDDEWTAWETYRQLDLRLQQDAAFAERFRSVLTTEPPPPAPAAPPPQALPEPPVDSYLAGDPAYRQMLAELQAVRAEQARQASIINAQRAAESQATINAVSAGFRSRHSLDDATFGKVYEQAQAFAGALPAMAQRGVPLDQALDQVLEAAYWAMPENREAEAARLAASNKASAAKKAKAGSLSGSSGSVPRQAAASEIPRGPAELQRALAAALAEGITGNLA